MRKSIKAMGIMALMVTMVFTMTSFVTTSNMKSDNSCTVTVKYSNGDPAKNVEVMPMNYSGVLGWMAASCGKFKTNSSGVVKISWSSETIKALYIKGNRYEMTLEDGKSYTVNLKQKHEYD